MIRFLFFSIVCAVSAPREGTAIIGRKNYGSEAFCHFDEGARKEAKIFSPRAYNVDAHNSSVFAKQKITNRTNSFNCDYINKQYQSGRSSLCSVVENVFQRKKKESFHSDVGLAFRKRNLLWSTNSFSPKTLRPPMDTESECRPSCPKPKGKCKKPKCRFRMNRKKKFKSDLNSEMYSLNCCEKKQFLRLKKLNGRTHKRHLDKVKIDDELDLNKRIQKLVQEIAVENQRTALTESTDQNAGHVVFSEESPPEEKQKSFPFFKKLKNMFRFNKKCFNNKKHNIDNPNSVPVNSVRGEVPVADKTAHICNYGAFKIMRETTRFRRNPYRNYVPCSHPVSRYRKDIKIKKPYSYSANYKKKAKFLYPQYKQRHFADIRRPYKLLHRPRIGIKPWPFSRQFILNPHIKDIRSKRHNGEFEQSMTEGGADVVNSNVAQNGRNLEPNGAEVITTESDNLEKPMDDSPSARQENLEGSNDEDDISDYTLEKPFLNRRFRNDFSNERGTSEELKTFEDRYNLQTDFPLFDNPTALHPYRRYKYDLLKDGLLNPYRYLKIRHALRNYLVHNNILSPARLDSSFERKKRCGGGKCCPMPHKCWRSPPLLCIPYIRKGQDDLLRYLIRTMQKMIGRPFPPKIDIFDNTKYKPCGKTGGHTCEDIIDDDEDCDYMTLNLPPPCMPAQPCCPPPPTTQSTCPCQIDPTSKLCACSQPQFSLPKPCPTSSYNPNNRPCPPTQRSCPYGNCNPAYEYPPISNSYLSSSPYPYSNDNIEQLLYSTQSYCGYDDPIPTVPPPCLPANPYYRSSLTSGSPLLPPLRPPSLIRTQASTNYPPTPQYNPYLRASERTPAAFTHSQYSPPSTANACSWYMSKSPVERTEYFDYTALPYNGPPEWVTAPSQLARSEPFKPENIQPPYLHSNVQANQPNPQKFNVQRGLAYAEHSPIPVAPGMNPPPNVERLTCENQCKDRHRSFDEVKQSDEVNTEQTIQLRKEPHGRTDAYLGDNFNDNPQGGFSNVQQHRLNENQMLKSDTNSGYLKNGNKENVHNAYKYDDQQSAPDDQQMLKAEANNEYAKALSKEQNPQIVQTSHPMLSAEANDGGNNKNQNSEDAYKCDSHRYSLNEQQVPKPETNVKEVKSPNKEETLRCPDRQCTSNERQQLPKPEINDVNDDRRFFKTKHHKGILKNFRKPATEFFHPYDDYYDKHPLMDPEELSGFRYGKSPFLRTWRGYSRKVKKSSKRDTSVRKKRGDNYAWPDSFENYNDYESDISYNDESSDDSKGSDEAPSYEMFSELAKAVTEFSSAVFDNGNVTNTSTPGNQTSGKTTPMSMSSSSLKEIAGKTDDVTKNNTAKGFGNDLSTPLNKLAANLSDFVKNITERNNNGNADKTIVASNKPANTATTASGATVTVSTSTAASTNVTHNKPSSNRTTASSAAVTVDKSTSANTSVASTKPSSNRTTASSAAVTVDKSTSANTSVAHNKSADSRSPASGGKVTLNTTTPAVHEYGADKGETIDSKKSEKTGFFQTNSKSLGIQANSGFLTTTKVSNMGSAREDKELEGNQDLDSVEGQIPTTLRMASIVKGPKKLLTKPSPKVYTKVYPDSIPLENEANESAITTAVTTAKAVAEKTTLAVGSTSDIQVQLLAVCEGYLEVIKLIKAQNQTLGDDLDTNLARYCENIISQNFNLQSDSSKPKKQESTQSPPPPAATKSTAAAGKTQNLTKSASNSSSGKSQKSPQNEMTEPAHGGKVVVDIPSNALYKRGTFDNAKRKEGDFKRKKLKCADDEVINNEGIGVSGRKEKSQLRRKKSNKAKDFCLSTQSNSKSLQTKPKRYRRKEQSEEELLRKGITKEQVELLHLLRKRKRALLSWLYNSKEVPNKLNDAQETEYFDDEEEIAQGSDLPSYSGTITPKEYEETSTTPESEWSFVNESIFPVYAKQYGYDRGGELMEVEVLWRKINEKTHEKKIFRNRSVLALLLTSTNEPNTNPEDSRLIANGFESEDISEIQSKSENKVGYADAVANFNRKTSTAPPTAKVKNSSSVNNTYTYISKPDPSSIVGAPPNLTKIHPNISRKISHKFGAAKDLFQEYTLEFLNYAVYILPIMFTVLFVFCCLCCAVQVLKTKKSSKKHKKKKKRHYSTEDSETTEDSERESKKKGREARRKKHSKDNAEDLAKKRSKTFWNVLKLNSAKSNPEFNDDSQTEKKKSFLRFLKGRKDEGKAEAFSSHYSPVREADEQDDVKESHNSDVQYHDERKRKDDNPKTYTQSEAEERRELIALLEELKKIETENTGEKKEVKSVHVQYMTQEDDGPVFQRPDFAFPYQKNVFGMPKGYSPCNKHFPFYQSDPATVRNYELFEDVNELTELLPCECNYYSKRNDYLRRCDLKIKQEGGCKSFIKIFRDAGVTRGRPFREKNLYKNGSENRSFIFNKYRSISTDTSDELLGVTQKSAGTEVRLTDNIYETASPFKLQSKKNTDFVEEMDSLKRQLKSKKHVRLKDDGVLCRL